MYLRVTKRRNADGSEVSYYQLAENVWASARGHAVAKVTHNFGRADELDEDQLRRLAASILRVVSDDAPVGSAAGDVQFRHRWPYGGVHVLEHLWKGLAVAAVPK